MYLLLEETHSTAADTWKKMIKDSIQTWNKDAEKIGEPRL
jgi:hypothetical protein